MLLYVDLLYRLLLRDEEGMKANFVVLAYEYADDEDTTCDIEWQAVLMARTTISLPTISLESRNENYESVNEVELMRLRVDC